MLRIVECGCCGHYHPIDYYVECRNDEQRFANEDEALERLGLERVEVERFEYSGGEVIERWVEIWPSYEFVENLLISDEES